VIEIRQYDRSASSSRRRASAQSFHVQDDDDDELSTVAANATGERTCLRADEDAAAARTTGAPRTVVGPRDRSGRRASHQPYVSAPSMAQTIPADAIAAARADADDRQSRTDARAAVPTMLATYCSLRADDADDDPGASRATADCITASSEISRAPAACTRTCS